MGKYTSIKKSNENARTYLNSYLLIKGISTLQSEGVITAWAGIHASFNLASLGNSSSIVA